MRVLVGGLVLAALAARCPAQDAGDEAEAKQLPTCTTSGCHLRVTQYERLHEPVAANKCFACHKPKDGATPFQPGSRHEFKRAGDDPELCYACHDRLASATAEGDGHYRFTHEPVKKGVCILCHDPHGAQHPSLLNVEVDRQLCARCHRFTFDQGDHIHPPVRDGTCLACHAPHGSDHKKFLRAGAPDLCLDCHDTIEDLLDEASVTHDPVTTDRSCLACHDPHATNVARLLVGEPMTLCLSCHDKELDSDGGRTRNMAQYLKKRPDHHGPIKDGNCTACHNPHGGTVFRLLADAYPVGPYAPYSEDAYALCLGCHDVEMVEEGDDEEATAFRNGELNLHYLHVNRPDKGTSCGACHDVHAGTSPAHIADPTSSGGKPLMIEFVPTATGGSCRTTCHNVWAYDRVRPVRNEKKETP